LKKIALAAPVMAVPVTGVFKNDVRGFAAQFKTNFL
jgi:hypothetical protein